MAPARNLDESDASMRARLVESLSQSFPGSALSKALHGIMGDYDSANAAVADDSDCSDVLSSSCFAELRLDKVKMEELEADDEDDELTSLAWLQDADLLKNIHTEGIYDDTEDGQKENEFGGRHGHAHPPHVPYNPQKHINSKPPYSFSCLIFMAIEDCPTKRLPVKDIYNWMVGHFPYFANAPTGWKNSVRHNLSLNKCFKKVDKDKGSSIGKGSLWMIDPDYRPNLLQALRKTPYHPYHQLQMLSATSPTTNFTMLPSGARLFPWTSQAGQAGSLNSPSPHLFPFLSKRLAQSKFETESDIDVANTLMSLKRGLESRPALKCQNGWPRSRSPSPPEFGSEQDKHLLREKHRARASIVCTVPPSDDHNYGVTEGQLRDMQDSPNSSIDGEYDFGRWGRTPSDLDEDTCSDCSGFDDDDEDVDEGCRDDRRLCVKLPHHSPVGKRKLSRSPVVSAKKMRVCVKVEDEDEKLKIVEGADALLNLAGITREPSMTSIVPLRSISPISPTTNDKTNNNNNEVKSET